MKLPKPVHRVFLVPLLLLVAACERQPSAHVADGVFRAEETGGTAAEETYDLPEIQEMGELIVLTLYGPITYFEFRGERFGSQYLLADRYARSVGVTARVEVCRSADEMLRKLESGEGDVIAANLRLPGSPTRGVSRCGTRELTVLVDTLAALEGDSSVVVSDSSCWLVRRTSPRLRASLGEWLSAQRPNLLALSLPKIEDDDGHAFTPRRHAASPMRNPARGEISAYDPLFKSYARRCGWDWRLLAAQAYQESAFDAQAVSWMGACGLLQLMPSTAKMVGVARGELFDAERNVAGAVRYLGQLADHYSGIRNPDDRINFMLAAYNAGPGHVDDVRELTRKYGHDADRWADVERYVPRMSERKFYNDPVVRHGYFRGSETYNYVRDIRARWEEYKRNIR